MLCIIAIIMGFVELLKKEGWTDEEKDTSQLYAEVMESLVLLVSRIGLLSYILSLTLQKRMYPREILIKSSEIWKKPGKY